MLPSASVISYQPCVASAVTMQDPAVGHGSCKRTQFSIDGSSPAHTVSSVSAPLPDTCAYDDIDPLTVSVLPTIRLLDAASTGMVMVVSVDSSRYGSASIVTSKVVLSSDVSGAPTVHRPM